MITAPKGGYFMRFVFYPAVFHPEEVGYSVTVPDVEGCFTQGDDMNEAVAMTQEAIGLMLEDCKVYPKPSSPADIRTEPGDFVTMIPFDEAAYKKQQKPVKKTLSIPAWLNEAAEEAHVNFSGVLQDALKAKLNIG